MKDYTTRRGKIARLPLPIREQLNQRLQNGEEGKQLLEWLNSLPETMAMLASNFDGQSVNEQNLSKWKLGGYRDWEEKQELSTLRAVFTPSRQNWRTLPRSTKAWRFAPRPAWR